MIKRLIFGLLAIAVSACVQNAENKDFLAQVYSADPNGPPTEYIVRRYPAIKPDMVEVRFGYSFECKNLKDVGVLIGWGKTGQKRDEIIHDFQTRAAKHGANLVVYEPGVSSVAEMDKVLHRRTSYSMMRCL